MLINIKEQFSANLKPGKNFVFVIIDVVFCDIAPVIRPGLESFQTFMRYLVSFIFLCFRHFGAELTFLGKNRGVRIELFHIINFRQSGLLELLDNFFKSTRLIRGNFQLMDFQKRLIELLKLKGLFENSW